MFLQYPAVIDAILREKVDIFLPSIPSPPVKPKSSNNSTSHITSQDAQSPLIFLKLLPTKVADLMSHPFFGLTIQLKREEYDSLCQLLFPDPVDHTELLTSIYNHIMQAQMFPKFNSKDDGREDPYRIFLEAFLRVQLGLIACKILDSWIDVLATNSEEVMLEQARRAVIFVAYLGCVNQKGTQTASDQRSVKPDITIETKKDFSASYVNICSIDAKTPAVGAYQHGRRSKESKDAVIATILMSDKDIRMSDAYNQYNHEKWARDAVELLGQMSSQAFRTESKMCLFTSVYGFCRVGVREEKGPISHFFVSDNFMLPENTNSVAQRKNPDVNMTFTRITFLFVLKALLAAKEDLFPPGERPMLDDVFSHPPVSISCSILLWQYMVLAVCFAKAAAQLLLAYFVGITKGFLTLNLVHVRFKTGRGLFRSMENGSWITLPALEFEVKEQNNGRLMGYNLEAGLVLKAFSDRETCKKEVDVYKELSNYAGSILPKFYNSYENEEAGLWGIVINYAGEPLGDIEVDNIEVSNIEVDDLRQIEKSVQQFHACGYHHHDLAGRNFVRGKDKKLRLVDFESAEKADKCLSRAAGERAWCPDNDWLDASEWTSGYVNSSWLIKLFSKKNHKGESRMM
ncbi:hypothetical protein CVT26_001345 [Gymnopilus dilepis]|uniref:Protein kinase domain-containing protein n=1 Tax=Gymnopilus dilepis TaxID=231916 RepID=A0A409YUP1_9AGAR|nr:hypothetical protein CVT26_001345 [Gymnopilus dilepis]